MGKGVCVFRRKLFNKAISYEDYMALVKDE
jgi:hypothetical protein